MTTPHENATFNICKPHWIAATGNDEQLVVHRSPMLRESDDWYRPVREHIERCRMVLVDRKTVENADMMFGSAEVSWYMTPEWRNAVFTQPESVKEVLRDIK